MLGGDPEADIDYEVSWEKANDGEWNAEVRPSEVIRLWLRCVGTVALPRMVVGAHTPRTAHTNMRVPLIAASFAAPVPMGGDVPTLPLVHIAMGRTAAGAGGVQVRLPDAGVRTARLGPTNADAITIEHPSGWARR